MTTETPTIGVYLSRISTNPESWTGFCRIEVVPIDSKVGPLVKQAIYIPTSEKSILNRKENAIADAIIDLARKNGHADLSTICSNSIRFDVPKNFSVGITESGIPIVREYIPKEYQKALISALETSLKD